MLQAMVYVHQLFCFSIKPTILLSKGFLVLTLELLVNSLLPNVFPDIIVKFMSN